MRFAFRAHGLRLQAKGLSGQRRYATVFVAGIKEDFQQQQSGSKGRLEFYAFRFGHKGFEVSSGQEVLALGFWIPQLKVIRLGNGAVFGSFFWPS